MNNIIESDFSDGTLTLFIGGRFDFRCVNAFRKAYIEVEDTIEKVIIDMRGTFCLDSSGLGMLLNMKGYLQECESFDIVNCQSQIKRILEISRFDKKFNIE